MYIYKKAGLEDINGVYKVIRDGIDYLKINNVSQWQNNYPNLEVLELDIKNNNLRIITTNTADILAVCAFIKGEDISYKNIYSTRFVNPYTKTKVKNNNWLTSYDNYYVIHRISLSKEKRNTGIATLFLKYLEKEAIYNNSSSIRVDTHKKNVVMQKFLLKNGFKFCGKIYLYKDNIQTKESRLAFEKLL
ncbi:MAG: GNAT family N-acetyltransferase [Acholeplasmatales bacterium]|jgi:GNAT superfamily N-acetyltransferase|nr:GNAT family N-acetyltransferase [Acholeplasmatales bacterium]